MACRDAHLLHLLNWRNLWSLNGSHLEGKYTPFPSIAITGEPLMTWTLARLGRYEKDIQHPKWYHTHLQTPQSTSSEKALITSHKNQQKLVHHLRELMWFSQGIPGIPTPKADTMPVSIVSSPVASSWFQAVCHHPIQRSGRRQKLACDGAVNSWAPWVHSWAIAN